MRPLTLRQLCTVVDGDLTRGDPDTPLASVTTDSRRIGNEGVFFALAGLHTNGHAHVAHAFANGAAAAVVSRRWNAPAAPAGALVGVDDPLAALQRLAAWWRGELGCRVVGVTGSNGKTIVKDALVQCLASRFAAVGNPGSHNSQLGVPLSVLRVAAGFDVAVLEAGVSAPGEMATLEAMLRPDCGILTNVGLAHIGSFGTRERIAAEKVSLFARIPESGWVLAPARCAPAEPLLGRLRCRVVRFGAPSDAIPWVEKTTGSAETVTLQFRFPGGGTEHVRALTPSLEIASDLEIAVAAAWLLGVPAAEIAAALAGHEPPHTRMEIWRSPTGVTLVNDSCSSDPMSVQAALQSLGQVGGPGGRRVFVFGGMRELGEREESEHAEIGGLAARSAVELLVLAGGAQLDATAQSFLEAAPGKTVVRCTAPADVAPELRGRLGPGDVVLFKGPRGAGIDRVAGEIAEAIAPNRFLVDLQAVAENVSRFRRLVGPHRRLVGMVKALAYGSDLVRVSKELQNLGLDVLGVSTPDEGAVLRRVGIDVPILVFFCPGYEADKVVRHHLTPVVYSFDLVEPLAAAAKAAGRVLDVHLKIDTGMGRLGVLPDLAVDLARAAAATGFLRVVGAATHFACAEDPAQDAFTRVQIGRFEAVVAALAGAGYSGLLCHAAATSGAARFPESKFDMVRIGLGLYGVYPGPAVEREIELDLAVSLVSRLTEVRRMAAGQGIGYGQTFRAPQDGFRVGMIPMGYADALPWQLANRGHVLVNGRPAPFVGRISMDSAAVDLTGVPGAELGADVLLYGRHHGYTLRPEDVAQWAGTIPYELLTRLGPRVQRIFLGR